MEKKPRKEYRNVERSKAALADGLIRLLLSGRPFEKITVSELCEEAGVNRGTFYNHYKCIEEIAQGIEKRYMDALEIRLDACNFESKESIAVFFAGLNAYLSEHQAQSIAISRCLPQQFFEEIRRQLCKATSVGLQKYLGNRPDIAEISAELDVLSEGIAVIYTELIIGHGKLTFDQAASACVGVLSRLFSGLKNE